MLFKGILTRLSSEKKEDEGFKEARQNRSMAGYKRATEVQECSIVIVIVHEGAAALIVARDTTRLEIFVQPNHSETKDL